MKAQKKKNLTIAAVVVLALAAILLFSQPFSLVTLTPGVISDGYIPLAHSTSGFTNATTCTPVAHASYDEMTQTITCKTEYATMFLRSWGILGSSSINPLTGNDYDLTTSFSWGSNNKEEDSASVTIDKNLKCLAFKADLSISGYGTTKANIRYGETVIKQFQNQEFGASFNEDGLFEVQPSILDCNIQHIYWKGQEIAVVDTTNVPVVKLNVEMHATSFYKQGHSGTIRVINPRWKPTFGCTMQPDELLAMETFTAGDKISLYSTRYQVQKFCLANPVIVTQAGQGSATTAEPYQRLLTGEVLQVPTGQTWSLFYIMKNDGSVPTNCPAQTYNVALKRCTNVTGIVNICSRGTFDATFGGCVVQAEVVCPEGHYDTTAKACLVNPPIQFICSDGTYDSGVGKCLSYPDEMNVCKTGTAYNTASGYCESFPSNQINCDIGYVYDPATNKCVRYGETTTILEDTYVCLSGTPISVNGKLECIKPVYGVNCPTGYKSVENVCVQDSQPTPAVPATNPSGDSTWIVVGVIALAIVIAIAIFYARKDKKRR